MTESSLCLRTLDGDHALVAWDAEIVLYCGPVAKRSRAFHNIDVERLRALWGEVEELRRTADELCETLTTRLEECRARHRKNVGEDRPGRQSRQKQ